MYNTRTAEAGHLHVLPLEINPNPLQDREILLTMISSNLKKKKKNRVKLSDSKQGSMFTNMATYP